MADAWLILASTTRLG